MSDKEEIVETIIRVVERTKTWRSTLATKYPNDRRNSRAVETLGMLAVEAPSLTDLQFRELKRIPVILKHSLRERNSWRIRLGLVVG